jgi:hypothetical protein
MTEALAKKKKGTPAVRQAPPAADPVQALNYILTSGGTPELVRQAMEIANAYQDRRAAEVYGERFARFQATLPQIEKTRAVVHKERGLMYTFAALEDIERVVQPFKAEAGLSTSGTIQAKPDGIYVDWTLQIGGHKVVKTYVLPAISSAGLLQGGANATQNLGAWMKYIQRYTYCMALGITIRDEDTDANAVMDMTLLTAEQRAHVDHWLAHGIVKPDGNLHKFTVESLLKWRQAAVPEAERSLDKLTQKDFDAIVATFKPKMEAKKA